MTIFVLSGPAPSTLSIAPGGSATFVVDVTNSADGGRNLGARIAIHDGAGRELPGDARAEWFRVTVPDGLLSAGATTQVTVQATAPDDIADVSVAFSLVVFDVDLSDETGIRSAQAQVEVGPAPAPPPPPEKPFPMWILAVIGVAVVAGIVAVVIAALPKGTDWYPDVDRDGYAASTDDVITSKDQPAAYAAELGDCDDLDDQRNPGQPETCDGIDNDCDGEVDDGLEFSDWFVDADGDGSGAIGASPRSSCSPLGSGWASTAEDCDDADSTERPGAPEQCDGLDNDCDGEVDEDIVTSTWWLDADGDGHGDASGATEEACKAPSGRHVAQGGDCDDADAEVHPGLTDVCDGKDNDCDGQSDEDVPFTNWFQDRDGDGDGASGSRPQTVCSPPGTGWVRTSGDCDDADPSEHSAAPEQCDGKDNDCDGQVDEGSVVYSWWVDGDRDGYGKSQSSATRACKAPGANWVTNKSDCDDSAASRRPGAREQCNGRDDDCDGSSDEGCCVDSVQDTVAWNSAGATRWASGNLNRLCRSRERSGEPAECIARAMHGGGGFGGGLGWSPALNLCESAENSDATLGCFRAETRAGSTTAVAAKRCGVDWVPCAGEVQGKIAWNSAGNTTWVQGNIDRLCAGAPNHDQPARCFERVMHGGIAHGGGTSWDWGRAVDLCEGTRNASATIACFEGKVRAGTRWDAAIAACD